MHDAGAKGVGCQRHLLGAIAMHGVEFLPAALGQDANQVDQHVGAACGRLDRAAMADIGLDRVNLADPANRLEMSCELRPAHRDADPVMALGQRTYHMPAEETRAAVNGDESIEWTFDAHDGGSLWLKPQRQ
jgi:hypothetical protein